MESQSLSTRTTQRLDTERWLLFLFLLSLALLNPWVRGDGVGYYAFARAPLIEHNFNFEHDYISANTGIREARLDEHGRPKEIFRTRTGHLDNHFTVGPAMLWTPFLLLAHGGVLLARAFGAQVPADGFSAPYRLAMAVGTAFWGFLGLLLSFRLARQYVEDVWAFLATISIWWASSLPVYMYFNPSWSHAHSAFAVSLFVFYWHGTREHRTLRQWLVLALIASLMLNVYYANAMLLVILVVEALRNYAAAFRGRGEASVSQLITRHFLFAVVTLLCLIPTFVTRYIARPVTAPCKTGRGARPTFLRCSFPPSTVCFPGRRCCCSPPSGWFYLNGASRASALRCWRRGWRFIFLLPAIRIGRGYLRLEIGFLFR